MVKEIILVLLTIITSQVIYLVINPRIQPALTTIRKDDWLHSLFALRPHASKYNKIFITSFGIWKSRKIVGDLAELHKKMHKLINLEGSKHGDVACPTNTK